MEVWFSIVYFPEHDGVMISGKFPKDKKQMVLASLKVAQSRIERDFHD